MVWVYKYTHNKFVPFHNISSEGVAQVSSFKIGFKSYIAISGYQAAIYQFTKTGIVPEKIGGKFLHTESFDSIDLWFPVPVKTYR